MSVPAAVSSGHEQRQPIRASRRWPFRHPAHRPEPRPVCLLPDRHRRCGPDVRRSSRVAVGGPRIDGAPAGTQRCRHGALRAFGAAVDRGPGRHGRTARDSGPDRAHANRILDPQGPSGRNRIRARAGLRDLAQQTPQDRSSAPARSGRLHPDAPRRPGAGTAGGPRRHRGRHAHLDRRQAADSRLRRALPPGRQRVTGHARDDSRTRIQR